MERSSGLKECPRCGLKNRQGVYQCDFCGWDFRSASDDWMGKVSDLENINREIAAPTLDRHTTSKIEMTMKRPSEIPVREPLEEHPEVSPPEADTPTVEASHDDTVVELVPPVEEEMGEVVPEPSPIVPLPAAEPAPPEPPVEAEPPVAHEAHVPAEKPLVHEAGEKDRLPPAHMVTVAMLVAGVALYIAAIVLATDLGKAAGWTMTIIGAFLIARSVRRFFVLYKQEEDDEIVICPNCHEVVSDQDNGCPSCGIKFGKPLAKE